MSNWKPGELEAKHRESLKYLDHLVIENKRLREEAEGIAFWSYVAITERWLKQYPADIFDGSSGDKGPLFVVAIREAVAKLKEGE